MAEEVSVLIRFLGFQICLGVFLWKNNPPEMEEGKEPSKARYAVILLSFVK